MRYLKFFSLLLLLCGCRSDMDPVPAIAISYRLDDADRNRLERSYPSTLEKIDDQRTLNLQDIKNLTRSGVADSVIIHEIQATRSIFYLTPEEVDELKHAGVSQRVISHMLETGKTHYEAMNEPIFRLEFLDFLDRIFAELQDSVLDKK